MSEQRKIIGNYELIEKVGQGASGAVFKARQISMDRIVALKVLPPKVAENEENVQRFMREAKSAAQCDHPHIVRGIEFGFADGYHFFAMEYMDGETLESVLDEYGPVLEDGAIEYMRQIAGALGEAHSKGIIHRDVKPENILLDDEGDAKLCDLGLPISDIETQKAGLEEIFLQITQTGR